MLSYPLSYNNFIVLTGFKREKKNEIGINKNILIYFVAERYIFPSENSRKKIKAFELLKEADDMLNMYVA